MKLAILLGLSLCSVAFAGAIGNAVDGVVDNAITSAKETAAALESQVKTIVGDFKTQLEDIVTKPAQEVTDLIDQIEDLKVNAGHCVETTDEDVYDVTGNFLDNIDTCTKNAEGQVVVLVGEVKNTVVDIHANIVEMTTAINKCLKKKRKLLKRLCLIKEINHLKKLVKKSRDSAETTMTDVPAKAPEILNNAEQCATTAADDAVQKLENIIGGISACLEPSS